MAGHVGDHPRVHQPVDLLDQPAFLTDIQEGTRCEDAALFMPPPQQRLRTDPVATAQPHHRLVERLERLGVDRAAQVRFHVEDAGGFITHLFVEHHAAVAPLALGAIHRRIRIAQHVLAVLVARMPQRDAHAGGGEQFAPGHPHRRAQCSQHAPAQFLGHQRALEVLGQDRELIAAQARDHVTAAHSAHDAAAGLDQQFVADCMTDAVVDQLEAVEIKEQHREAGLMPSGCGRDGARQSLQQLRAIRQAGQAIMQGLVGELAFGTHAFADLLHQLGIGLGKFAGALADPLLQAGMRLHQPVLRLLASQATADVVRHEGQQFLVMGAEYGLGRVALHCHHADHAVVMQQRHAQPAMRQGAEAAHLAGPFQLADTWAIRQQRLPHPQDVFGQPAPHLARRTVAIALVHRVREVQHAAVVRQHRDVEIARVQQPAHHLVDLGVELLQGVAGHRQLGDAEQRALQLLRALPFPDLRLQHLVGVLQLGRAFRHPAFQLLAGIAAVQRGQDVLGHVGQQDAVIVRIGVLALVALHHDGADHHVLAAHRHAQPVRAVGAVLVAERNPECVPQVMRRPRHRLATAQQLHGQGVLVILDRKLLVGIVDPRIHLVDEIQEAHRLVVRVVQHDVEVLGVHQLADDPVQAAQHVLQLQAAAGEIGDLVQRLLQPFGAMQRVDAARGQLQQQRHLDLAFGADQPGLAGRQRGALRRADRDPQFGGFRAQPAVFQYNRRLHRRRARIHAGPQHGLRPFHPHLGTGGQVVRQRVRDSRKAGDTPPGHLGIGVRHKGWQGCIHVRPHIACNAVSAPRRQPPPQHLP